MTFKFYDYAQDYLNGVACFRCSALKTDNNLKLSRLQILWWEIVQRWATVNLVSDHQRPEKLEVIVLPTQACTKVETVKVVGHRLSLLRLDPGEEVAGDVAADEVVGAQVAKPDQQVEVAVPPRYQSILAEHDRLPSVGWLREFGKDNAGHTGLHEFSFSFVHQGRIFMSSLHCWADPHIWEKPPQQKIWTWMMTPTMLWTHMSMIAWGHSSVAALPP